MQSAFRLAILSFACSSLSAWLALPGARPRVAEAGVVPIPVVGGTLVAAGEWPDAVAVLAADAACTGVLIAPDVVLTAAHCIAAKPVDVIVDTTDYAGTRGELIRVRSATAYPGWQDHYDVGVLVLDEPATSAKPRAIVSACTAGELTAGTAVRVVGFGLTTTAGTGASSTLHEVSLTVTDATCSESPDCKPAIAPDGEFEAGAGSGGGACFGDSGGPAYLGTGSAAALVGIVSRGLASSATPCGDGGVYVRADKVVPWIESVTGRTMKRESCGSTGADGGKSDGETDVDPAASNAGAEPHDGDDGGCAAGGSSLGGGGLAALLGLVTFVWVVRTRR